MVVQTGAPVQSARPVGPVTDPDILEGYRRDASPLCGDPEGLLRPDSAEEAAWGLAEAAARGIAVTPCGLRSSTTGAGLAPHGWTMSCERLTGLLELDPARRRAVVGAGAVLREFKDQVEAEGLFYPPDPTSERECSIGGTVACDASGARTYRYGPTHRWVRGLEVAFLDGTVRWIRRREVDKDSTGFAALRDLVGLLCGSEGTLGFVTKVEVDLLVRPEGFLAGLAFFEDLGSALRFVGAARGEDRRGSGVRPRCLELLDLGCLDIMRGVGSGVSIPAGARASVFFEEEHAAGAEDGVLERWWALLERSPGALPDDTVVADDPARQDELRRLRHAIPATLNEEGASYLPAGGRKVSTDWAVPFERLPGFMEECDRRLAEAGVDRVFRYGHVGNGHPHYNLLVRDRAQKERADAVVDWMCREACRLGGTIAAEHGVGKIKLPYVKYRFDPLELGLMRALKDRLDPRGLLAPGNLFP